MVQSDEGSDSSRVPSRGREDSYERADTLSTPQSIQRLLQRHHLTALSPSSPSSAFLLIYSQYPFSMTCTSKPSVSRYSEMAARFDLRTCSVMNEAL